MEPNLRDPAAAIAAAHATAGLPPDAASVAFAIVIADIVHELRRAANGPICRATRGQVAASHNGAVVFGWMRPAAERRAFLELTQSGWRTLAAAREARL